MIPHSFLEFSVLIKALYRQIICLQASEEPFLQTQCLTHCVSHPEKLCVHRGSSASFPHSPSEEGTPLAGRGDAPPA